QTCLIPVEQGAKCGRTDREDNRFGKRSERGEGFQEVKKANGFKELHRCADPCACYSMEWPGARIPSSRRRMRVVTGSSAVERRLPARSGVVSMVFPALSALICKASSETLGRG